MVRAKHFVFTLLLATACGQSERSGELDTMVPTGGIETAGVNPGDTEGPGDDDFDTGTVLDVGSSDTDAAGDQSCPSHDVNATLRGTVYSPNLEIPISGALVYWATEDPDPVPDGVYCSECVGVPCGADFVLTEADGSFELPAVAGSNRRLVVAKGQFLRSTDLEIAEGANTIEPAQSSLPGEWNPAAGMWIPRIAVINTPDDTIFNVLAKIGLGEVNANGRLQEGTEHFDRFAQKQGGALLDDLDAMRQYHIIFVPCMAQVEMGNVSEDRIANIRQWVAEGGKFYVTDWANEYLYKTFPEYQTFHNQASDPDLGLYDANGTVRDPGLLAWLEALPPNLKDIGQGQPTLEALPSVGLHHNWSGIDQIPPVIAVNEDGDEVDVGHYNWVEGPCETCSSSGTRPMTVSAEFGCGRMMFSTYHTNAEPHAGLSPQELILLYIILEIGVCHDDAPPQAPPVG